MVDDRKAWEQTESVEERSGVGRGRAPWGNWEFMERCWARIGSVVTGMAVMSSRLRPRAGGSPAGAAPDRPPLLLAAARPRGLPGGAGPPAVVGLRRVERAVGHRTGAEEGSAGTAV